MKVVYKKTIIDKLVEKIYEAARLNKEVDYILLSRAEYVEFRKHPESLQNFCFDPSPPYADLSIRTIELRNPDRYGPPYIRFPSFSKFNGVDLYVVPDEFL